MAKSPHTGGERGIVPDWRAIELPAGWRYMTLAICRAHVGQPPVEAPVALDWQTVCAQRGDAHPERCPTCGQLLVCTSVIPRGGAPPPGLAREYAA
jgi:hypothetical protein